MGNKKGENVTHRCCHRLKHLTLCSLSSCSIWRYVFREGRGCVWNVVEGSHVLVLVIFFLESAVGQAAGQGGGEVALAIIDGVVTWSSLCKLSFSETRAVSGWTLLYLGRGLESCERDATKKGAADVCRVEASLWFCLDYCMKTGIILVFILT